MKCLPEDVSHPLESLEEFLPLLIYGRCCLYNPFKPKESQDITDIYMRIRKEHIPQIFPLAYAELAQRKDFSKKAVHNYFSHIHNDNTLKSLGAIENEIISAHPNAERMSRELETVFMNTQFGLRIKEPEHVYRDCKAALFEHLLISYAVRDRTSQGYILQAQALVAGSQKWDIRRLPEEIGHRLLTEGLMREARNLGILSPDINRGDTIYLHGGLVVGHYPDVVR